MAVDEQPNLRDQYGRDMASYLAWLKEKLGAIPATGGKLYDTSWFPGLEDRCEMYRWAVKLSVARRTAGASGGDQNYLVRELKKLLTGESAGKTADVHAGAPLADQ